MENRDRSRRNRNINFEGQDQQRDNARWDPNWSENSDTRNIWNGRGSTRHWTNWRESTPNNQQNRRPSPNEVEFLGIVEPQPQASGSRQITATQRTNGEPLSQEELIQDAYWNDFTGRESDRIAQDLARFRDWKIDRKTLQNEGPAASYGMKFCHSCDCWVNGTKVRDAWCGHGICDEHRNNCVACAKKLQQMREENWQQ